MVIYPSRRQSLYVIIIMHIKIKTVIIWSVEQYFNHSIVYSIAKSAPRAAGIL